MQRTGITLNFQTSTVILHVKEAMPNHSHRPLHLDLMPEIRVGREAEKVPDWNGGSPSRVKTGGLDYINVFGG